MTSRDPAYAVLLTGATGAIGSAVLDELLKHPDTHVIVLLRAASASDAKVRLQSLLAFLGRSGTVEVEPVLGDLSQPALGLDPEVFRRCVDSLTGIIHAAGNVKLNQSLDAARRDSVLSTRHILELAQACRSSGRFQKCEFVSTVGVGGEWKGGVPEQPLPRPRQFRNTYEEAKAEAEDMVLSQIQAGLPATIHRPSMVVGDSRTGRIPHFQVFYYLIEFLLGRRSWGILPRLGKTQLDIIPADYVARAIVLSHRHTATAGRIFHLCSGPQKTMSLVDLGARARAYVQQRGQPLPTLKYIDPGWIKHLLPIAQTLLPGKLKRPLSSLPFLLSYLDSDQFFNNALTDAFLSSENLPVPPVDSYLERVLDYYLIHKR